MSSILGPSVRMTACSTLIGLSLHYYTHPGGWDNKGSATEFDEKTWYQTLYKALYIEDLIKMHTA